MLHTATVSGVLACLMRHFRASLASLPLLAQPLSALPIGTWSPTSSQAAAIIAEQERADQQQVSGQVGRAGRQHAMLLCQFEFRTLPCRATRASHCAGAVWPSWPACSLTHRWRRRWACCLKRACPACQSWMPQACCWTFTRELTSQCWPRCAAEQCAQLRMEVAEAESSVLLPAPFALQGNAYTRLQFEDVTVGQALALAGQPAPPPQLGSGSASALNLPPQWGGSPRGSSQSLGAGDAAAGGKQHRLHVCTPSDSLRTIVERLSMPGVRRLIAVDGDTRRVEGIVSLSDVAAFLLL